MQFEVDVVDLLKKGWSLLVKVLYWLIVLVVLLIIAICLEVYVLGTTYTRPVASAFNSYVYPIFPESMANVWNEREQYDNMFQQVAKDVKPAGSSEGMSNVWGKEGYNTFTEGSLMGKAY